MFSGSRNPTVLLGILCDVTGSQQSKMTASNLEIRISRLVDIIAINYIGYPDVIGVKLSNEIDGNAV